MTTLYVGGQSVPFSSLSLQGDDSVCAQTLHATVVTEGGEGVSLHAPVVLAVSNSDTFFVGVVVSVSRDGDAPEDSIVAMDYGYILAGNAGRYIVDETAEQATQRIGRDIGLTVGDIAQTGVRVTQSYIGTGLHNVLRALFDLASEQTGARYCIRFEGTALTVRPYAKTASTVIEGGCNLQLCSQSIDASRFCNVVDIYSQTGSLIRTVGEPEEGAPVIRTAIEQRTGEDGELEAQSLLLEGKPKVTITARLNGDWSLRTGETVEVKNTVIGVLGRFYIVSHSHSVSRGQFVTTLTLEEVI